MGLDDNLLESTPIFMTHVNLSNSHPENPSDFTQSNTLRTSRASQHRVTFSDPWQHKCVLSLDGGGIRGLSSLYILRDLMAEIEIYERTCSPPAFSSWSSPLYASSRAERDVDGARFLPCHYFDYVFGTNLGGIHAILLGVQRLTVDHALACAIRVHMVMETPEIPSSFWHKRRSRSKKSSSLRKALAESLEPASSFDVGENEWMGSARVPRSFRSDDGSCQTIVFTTQKTSRDVQRPFVLRSFSQVRGSPWNGNSNTNPISLVDAGRASVSDSTYDSVKIRSFHGSFRNASTTLENSALGAYEEVTRIHRDRIKCLLSIGSDDSGDQSAMEAFSKENRFTYARWSSKLLLEGDSPETVERLTREFCARMKPSLQKWAKTLVETRRRRALTVEWSKFAGLRMFCPFCHETESDGVPFDVTSLQKHFRGSHAGQKGGNLTV